MFLTTGVNSKVHINNNIIIFVQLQLFSVLDKFLQLKYLT